MPRIGEFGFGHIVVDGTEYRGDIIILPGRVLKWWRKEGHLLHLEDLSEVLDPKPSEVVIGTGHDGMMSIPSNVKIQLEAKGISVKVLRTREAVSYYNERADRDERIIAALHLTC